MRENRAAIISIGDDLEEVKALLSSVVAQSGRLSGEYSKDGGQVKKYGTQALRAAKAADMAAERLVRAAANA
jgi:phage shock protein A